jgi:hypothetical protein
VCHAWSADLESINMWRKTILLSTLALRVLHYNASFLYFCLWIPNNALRVLALWKDFVLDRSLLLIGATVIWFQYSFPQLPFCMCITVGVTGLVTYTLGLQGGASIIRDSEPDNIYTAMLRRNYDRYQDHPDNTYMYDYVSTIMIIMII